MAFVARTTRSRPRSPRENSNNSDETASSSNSLDASDSSFSSDEEEVRTEVTVEDDCIDGTQLGDMGCATKSAAIEKSLSDVETDVSELVRGNEKASTKLPITHRIGRSLMRLLDKHGKSPEMYLLEAGHIEEGKYSLDLEAETPDPRDNEVVVFAVHFEAGLRIPCHPFVLRILSKYNLQVHHLTSNAIVQLSKFIWAMTTYGGKPCEKIFAQHYEVHRQPKKVVFDDVEYEAQYGNCTFRNRQNVEQLGPAAKSRWADQWYRCWFYMTISPLEVEKEGEVRTIFPLHTRMVPVAPSVFPPGGYKVDGLDRSAFFLATQYSSGRDLVDEFVAANVSPLSRDWSIASFMEREIPVKFDIAKCIFPAFGLERPIGKSDEAFVKEVEAKVEKYIGKYVYTEYAFAKKNLCHKTRLNRVFDELKVKYSRRPTPSLPTSKRIVEVGCTGSGIPISKSRKRKGIVNKRRVVRKRSASGKVVTSEHCDDPIPARSPSPDIEILGGSGFSIAKPTVTMGDALDSDEDICLDDPLPKEVPGSAIAPKGGASIDAVGSESVGVVVALGVAERADRVGRDADSSKLKTKTLAVKGTSEDKKKTVASSMRSDRGGSALKIADKEKISGLTPDDWESLDKIARISGTDMRTAMNDRSFEGVTSALFHQLRHAYSMASSMRDKAKDLKSSRAFREATSELQDKVEVLAKEKEKMSQKMLQVEIARDEAKELLATLKVEFKVIQERNDAMAKEIENLKGKVIESEREKSELKFEISDLRSLKVLECQKIRELLIGLLGGLGAEASDMGLRDGKFDIACFVDWLCGVAEGLPSIVEKANDFVALASFESLLTLLSKEGCDHYWAFGKREYSIDPDFSKDVCERRKVVAKRLVRILWRPFGRDLARQAATGRLDEARQQEAGGKARSNPEENRSAHVGANQHESSSSGLTISEKDAGSAPPRM